MRRLAVLSLLGLLLCACGVEERRAAAEPAPTSAGPASTTIPAPASTTTATIAGLALDPPAGMTRCAPADLEVAPGSMGLAFVRLFNRGATCGLAGYAGLEGRRADGSWTTIPTVPLPMPATNGPPWTGAFAGDRVAVLGFRETACGTSANRTRYDDARLVLPGGAGVVVLSIAFDVSACPVQVLPFSADSQDP